MPSPDRALGERAQPTREVGDDLGQLLDRVGPGPAAVESEVGHGEAGAKSLGEDARPLDLTGRLLSGVGRAEEVHVVRSVQREVDVERAGQLLGLVEVAVVLGEAPGQRRQLVLALEGRRERREERRADGAVDGPHVHDELLEELVRHFADLLVEDRARQRIDLDELDLHRREAEVMHIGDPITERPPLARERDPRGSEPDQE